MRSGHAPGGFCLFAMAFLFTIHPAFSAQMVSTPTRGLSAVMQTSGFTIQSAGTAEAGPGDLAPPQLLEIVRPGDQPFSIGRIFTSCTCVRLEADSRAYGQGERAVLRLRNIVPTPPAGMNYAIYVQISKPIRATLRFDTYMQSSQFVPAAAGLQPTRGDIVSDGSLVGGLPATDIEIIVPKADNYIPDTSEYTRRKKAALEAAAGKETAVAEKTDKTAAPADKKPAVTEEKETAATKEEPATQKAAEARASNDKPEVDAAESAATDAAGDASASAAAEADDKAAPASAPVVTEEQRKAIAELKSHFSQAEKEATAAEKTEADSVQTDAGDTVDAMVEEMAELEEKADAAADDATDTAEKAAADAGEAEKR